MEAAETSSRVCHELATSLCEIFPPPHRATGQSLCGLRLKGTSLPGWLRTPRSAKDPFYACSVPHFLTGAAVSIRFCHGAPLAPMKPISAISPSCPYIPDYAGLFGGSEPRLRAPSPMRPFPRRAEETPIEALTLRTKSPLSQTIARPPLLIPGLDGSGSAACHVRPIAPRPGSRCRCIADALLHTQTQTQTDSIPHPFLQ